MFVFGHWTEGNRVSKVSSIRRVYHDAPYGLSLLAVQITWSAAIFDAKAWCKQSHSLTGIDPMAVANHVEPYPSVGRIERNPCDAIGKSLKLLVAQEKTWGSDIFDVVKSVYTVWNM